MIDGITQNSKHIIVSSGSASGPYFNNSGQAMVGQLRYNPVSSRIEVYDGNTWVIYPSSYPSIGLTQDAEKAIDWAIKKQQEELELDELCKKHPALSEAYERLQILRALTKEGDNNNEKGQT
jgi:hypothetical protein